MTHAFRLALIVGLSACLSALLPNRVRAAAPIEVPPGVIAYLPLDESTREVTLHTPDSVQAGVYYPADDADHDTPEATQYERYRVEGKVAGGLRFFAADRSRAVVEGFRLSEPQPTLALSVFVKPGGERISSLVSCRIDSDKQGFALYKWGGELRFQFGDGAAAHVVKSAAVHLSDDQWHHLEVEFDRGTVRFFHNGAAVGESTAGGTAIAPSRRPLTLGTYPAAGRGRERSSFNGVLDEVVIADSRATIHGFLKRVSERGGVAWYLSERTRILDATPQPVEGNEQHFGKPVLHSFHGRPVPLTFVFKGEAEQIRSAALIIDVPEDAVTIRDAFTGSRNYPDRRISLKTETIDRDGRPYTRYRTTGFDLTDRLTPAYQGTKSPSVTVGFDGPVSTTEVYWSLEVDGEVYGERSFDLRILEPLPLPQAYGRFKVFSFAASAELTYFEKPLQEAVADLYLASNIRGKGRFYSSHPDRWVAFDDYLAGRGFEFFELGLWYGPLRSELDDEPQPPPAIRADGSEDPHYRCPTRFFASSELQRRYKQHKQKRLDRTTDGESAILDYEPWGVTHSICFCEACVSSFAERYDIREPLTPDRITQAFKPQWTDFWLSHSAEATRLVHELVKEYNPALRVMEYTYFFDYADPEALERRFWSIAKDPRRHEKYVDSFLLSAYHVNGREYFDLLDQSVRTLGAQVNVIASLSRANALQGRYTTPEESLSPVQVRQKAIASAAFGVEWFGLYPGNWIDGAYHVALREASDLVWRYESYFDEAMRRDDLVRLTPRDAASGDLASLAFARPDGSTLVALFNFGDAEQKARVEPIGLRSAASPRDERGETYPPQGPWDVAVPAHGVRMIEWPAGSTRATE